MQNIFLIPKFFEGSFYYRNPMHMLEQLIIESMCNDST
jgi:hypothetical protein